jgi:hypothetical protein
VSNDQRHPSKAHLRGAGVALACTLALLAAACGGGGGDGDGSPPPGDSPAPSVTAEPSFTPAPETTAITQEYVSEEYGFRLGYTDGFVLTEDPPSFDGGGNAVLVLGLDPAAGPDDESGAKFTLWVYDDGEPRTRDDWDAFVADSATYYDEVLGELPEIHLGEVESAEVDGTIGATVVYTYEEAGLPWDVWRLHLYAPDTALRFEMQAESLEAAAEGLEPVWESIVNSFEVL